MTRRRAVGLAVACALIAMAGLGTTAATESLTITFLANEGFLLRSGPHAVLIDAFVKDRSMPYGALPDSVHRRMIEGREPFQSIDLALVSHNHADHFQPQSAVDFLDGHPEAQIVSSPDVLASLREAGPDRNEFRSRLHEAWPEPGQILTYSQDSITVHLFRLRHGYKKNYRVQNLGHLIEIGGFTVLHLGDAELREENFEPYDLASWQIDVALVPFWYFLSVDGREMVERRFPAVKTIAVHIPPADLELYSEEIRQSSSNVTILREPMEWLEL